MKKRGKITPRWGLTLTVVLSLTAVLYLGAETLLGASLLPDRERWSQVEGYVGEAYPRVLTVPYLTGRRYAEEMLPDPTLFPCEVTYVYHPMAEAGRILAQTPEGGASRKVSRERPCRISLTVSMGRAQARLPQLAGLDPREAESILRRLGLNARRIEVGVTNGGYAVTDTRPEAGSLLDCGQTVTLLVPRQERAVALPVPDLTGMTVEEAGDALTNAGLTLGGVEILSTQDPWGIRVGGVVCAQSHTAGDLLPVGHAVNVQIR